MSEDRTAELHATLGETQEEKGYPQLREELQDMIFKSKGFLQRLLIPKEVRKNIVRVASEAVQEGRITDEWYLEDTDKSRSYTIDLTEEEAQQLLRASARFFNTPFHAAFDEALPKGMSDLLSGNAPRERYTKVEEDTP